MFGQPRRGLQCRHHGQSRDGLRLKLRRL